MRVGIADHEIEGHETEEAVQVDARARRKARDGLGDVFVAAPILAVEAASARLAQDLREVLQPQPLAALSVEPLDEECDAVDAVQSGELRACHLRIAQYLARQA